MKFHYLYLFFLLLISFVSSSSICLTETCENFGDVVQRGPLFYYCDFDSGSLCSQKGLGEDCLNDFECLEGYSCLSTCTRSFEEIIANFSAANAFLSGLCYDGGLFCSNLTISNSDSFSSKNCSFKGEGFSCYKCKSGFYLNETLGMCITGICDSTPGCLGAPINNSVNSTDYCPNNQKCYSCESSDYRWNSTLGDCVLRECDSSPGCMNLTNLSNAYVTGLKCPSGQSCFRCNSNRAWDVNSSSCMLSTRSDSTWYALSSSVADFEVGAYKSFSSRDKVSFTFAGRAYYFGLLSVSTRISFEIGVDSITGNVTPTIKNQVLYSGENRNYDLDNDGTYDLKVVLKNISSGKANVSLKFISETYLLADSDSDDTFVDIDDSYSDTDDSYFNTQTDSGSSLDLDGAEANEGFVQKNMVVIIILSIVLIILLIGLVFYLYKKDSIARQKSSDSMASSSSNQPRPPVNPTSSNVPSGYPVGGYRPLQPVQPRLIQPGQSARPTQPGQQ